MIGATLAAAKEKPGLLRPGLHQFTGNYRILDDACSGLQRLGRTEAQLLRGLDLDGFAGPRIAAHARRALGDREDAEVADRELTAALDLLQAGFDRAEHQFDHALGFCLRQVALLGHCKNEV